MKPHNANCRAFVRRSSFRHPPRPSSSLSGQHCRERVEDRSSRLRHPCAITCGMPLCWKKRSRLKSGSLTRCMRSSWEMDRLISCFCSAGPGPGGTGILVLGCARIPGSKTDFATQRPLSKPQDSTRSGAGILDQILVRRPLVNQDVRERIRHSLGKHEARFSLFVVPGLDAFEVVGRLK